MDSNMDELGNNFNLYKALIKQESEKFKVELRNKENEQVKKVK